MFFPSQKGWVTNQFPLCDNLQLLWTLRPFYFPLSVGLRNKTLVMFFFRVIRAEDGCTLLWKRKSVCFRNVFEMVPVGWGRGQRGHERKQGIRTGKSEWALIFWAIFGSLYFLSPLRKIENLKISGAFLRISQDIISSLVCLSPLQKRLLFSHCRYFSDAWPGGLAPPRPRPLEK